MTARGWHAVCIGCAGLCISRSCRNGCQGNGCRHCRYGRRGVLHTTGKKDCCDAEEKDDERVFIYTTKLIRILINQTETLKRFYKNGNQNVKMEK